MAGTVRAPATHGVRCRPPLALLRTWTLCERCRVGFVRSVDRQSTGSFQRILCVHAHRAAHVEADRPKMDVRTRRGHGRWMNSSCCMCQGECSAILSNTPIEVGPWLAYIAIWSVRRDVLLLLLLSPLHASPEKSFCPWRLATLVFACLPT